MKNILLVDDDEATREVLKGILERRGYSVLGCRNYDEASKIIYDRAVVVDAAFFDQVLSMDGTKELERRYGKEENFRFEGTQLYDMFKLERPNIPCCLLSAFASLETKKNRRFMPKPLILREINNFIENI